MKESLVNFHRRRYSSWEDGSADLKYVLDVARNIGRHMESFKIIVDKSTVPVGTADKVRAGSCRRTGGAGDHMEFDVVSNPEFLKEGAAIDDFMKPDRVVIGTDNVRTAELMKELYSPFMRKINRLIVMDIRSAEMTKYAANAMLATKISFMNQIANLCDLMGADVAAVREGIGSDSRIGYDFLFPGVGYGGSCFPKDVKALVRTAEEYDYDYVLLKAVEEVNERQKRVLPAKIAARLGTRGAPGRWREEASPSGGSPSSRAPTTCGKRLRWSSSNSFWKWAQPCTHMIPKAIKEAMKVFGERVTFSHTPYEILEGADALAIVTEWNEYRNPDFDKIKSLLKQPMIFDGRNLYRPASHE